jgi:hypothetical protein
MSQTTDILDALLAGDQLTPMDALRRFGCFRLGARIWDLKQQGFDIHTETVHNGEKHYARYSIKNAQLRLRV